MPDPRLRLKSLINASKALKIGGHLLIATPDSANEYKHRHWMKDWFQGLVLFYILIYIFLNFNKFLNYINNTST